MKQKTIGALSREASSKPLETRDPIELARQNAEEYMTSLFECIDIHKKLFSGAYDFYIVVTTKQEPLMKNVYRNYFAGTLDCPTPDYDQAVYHYWVLIEKLELLWALPHEAAARMYQDHALEVIPEEKDLLRDILDFYDGTLLRLVLKLNGETSETPKIQLKVLETPEGEA